MGKGIGLVLFVVGLFLILNSCLPDDQEISIKEDATKGQVAAFKVFETVGLIEVKEVKNFFIFKTGKMCEESMILLPFTDGWMVYHR